jgi:Trk K+ transport system NAD-binding subunit
MTAPIESSTQRRRIRAQLLLKQNRAALIVVVLWFLANYLIFTLALHRDAARALSALFYFEQDPSKWGHFYMIMSDFVVFGMVVSVVATGISRHYRPEQTCSILAESARDHVVVIGYTNLGKRVVELCHHSKVPVVVIDPDREKVATLVQNEQPVVIESSSESSALKAASVHRAKVVVIAEDGVEAGAIAARRVRAIAPDVTLVVRCADDDVGQVLARAYAAKVVSTSRLAARHVEQSATKHGPKRCVLIGNNSLSARIYTVLRARGIDVKILTDDENSKSKPEPGSPIVAPEDLVKGSSTDYEGLRAAGAHDAEMVVLTSDNLGHALVTCERVRDLNTQARVIVRVFHEDAAAILTQAPFRAEVVSSSRHAVRSLVRDGAFEAVGIERNANV